MFEILAARWNLLSQNPSICINLSNMLIYGIICKWRDINNPLLIKLMQNLHFMKTCWSMIEAKLSVGDDEEVDKATKTTSGWFPNKIISFYNLEDNTKSCYYRSSAQKHKNSSYIFLDFSFQMKCKFYLKSASHKSCFCESNLFGQLYERRRLWCEKLALEINSSLTMSIIDAVFIISIWRLQIRNDIDFF